MILRLFTLVFVIFSFTQYAQSSNGTFESDVAKAFATDISLLKSAMVNGDRAAADQVIEQMALTRQVVERKINVDGLDFNQQAFAQALREQGVFKESYLEKVSSLSASDLLALSDGGVENISGDLDPVMGLADGNHLKLPIFGDVGFKDVFVGLLLFVIIMAIV